FEQLKSDPELVWRVANERSLQPLVDNFSAELEFWFSAMRRAQREHPVDVVYWFTPTTDIAAHFSMYSDDNPVLIKLYQLLDSYVGAFADEMKPEMTVFLSDHGQQNFRHNVNCSDPDVQREAFSSRDKVLWMPNGYIAFEAQNGGLIFTTHTLKGVFVASGAGIRRARVGEMRTVDIYPTLLEMFGAKVPSGRSGYVADIFSRPVANPGLLLKSAGADSDAGAGSGMGERSISCEAPPVAGPVCDAASALLLNGVAVRCRRVAFVQTCDVSRTDVMLNELWIEKRFARITVAGEAKYEEIFRNNPRVSGFVDIDRFDSADFDEVYCGFFNETTKAMRHVRVK
ncbi:MAG: hypothetical protein LBL83_01470, partial [Clostridiales bacterium]|nr:hypothetical protein [Clostridiales bacterium]